MILPATDANLDAAAEILAGGGLVAIPTETVYGLAASVWQPAAVRGIFAAKGRPSHNPLIVHVASVDRLPEAIRWPPDPVIAEQLHQLAEFWPGPLTVVCPRADTIPDEVTAGRTTVAVRIPAHEVTRRLLDRCPFPLAAPSANRSGYVSPTLAEHVCGRAGLGDAVAMVLDGGPCQHGVESTIVLLGDHPRLLRPGSITAEQLAARLGVAEASLTSTDPHVPEPSLPEPQSSFGQALPAPGMLLEHYAPRTPLRLISPADGPPSDLRSVGSISPSPTGLPLRLGRIAFRPLPPGQSAPYAVVETLSHDGELEEVARLLFAALRRLDDLGLDRIDCDTCAEVGLGRAIMDRLRRASARWNTNPNA